MTLKVVSESPVTWPTSVPILVFLGLSVLDLDRPYVRDRQTDVRRQTKASLNASALWGRRYNKGFVSFISVLITATFVVFHFHATNEKLEVRCKLTFELMHPNSATVTFCRR